MNLTQKVVVITGASKGLGAVMADMFRGRGAQVIISARDKAALDEVAKKTGAVACVADVTKPAHMEKVADFAVQKFGTIDIWINNAGIWLPRGLFEQVDMKSAHDLFEVNLFGMMYGCRAALAHMKKHTNGTIVNIISTAALAPRPYTAVYAASKAAEKNFTDSLREELIQEGTNITLIGVYPGGIKTHLFDVESQAPKDFDLFLAPETVAEKIITNLEQDQPELEQVIKRPGQEIQK